MEEDLFFEYITDAAIQISEISVNEYENDSILSGYMTIESRYTKFTIDYNIANNIAFIRDGDDKPFNTELFERIFIELMKEKIRLLDIEYTEDKHDYEQNICIKWEK